jgi:hypothetical protein
MHDNSSGIVSYASHQFVRRSLHAVFFNRAIDRNHVLYIMLTKIFVVRRPLLTKYLADGVGKFIVKKLAEGVASWRYMGHQNERSN